MKKPRKKQYELSFRNLQSLLIAGIPGSGKTRILFYILLNEVLRHSPQQMRVAYIDLKPLDSPYLQGLPHLIAPIAIKPDQAEMLIQFSRDEINRRRDTFYETQKKAGWYQLILVIDELREMIVLTKGMAKELASINALGRQYGIYLLCATQYPKAELLTSDLLACFASRICLRVNKSQESKTILDETGAEKLGQYEALIQANKISGTHKFRANKSAKIQPSLNVETDLPRIVNQQINLYGECRQLLEYDSVKSELDLSGNEFDEQINLLRPHFASGTATHKKIYDKLVELTGSGVGNRGKKIICESLNRRPENISYIA